MESSLGSLNIYSDEYKSTIYDSMYTQNKRSLTILKKTAQQQILELKETIKQLCQISIDFKYSVGYLVNIAIRCIDEDLLKILED